MPMRKPVRVLYLSLALVSTLSASTLQATCLESFHYDIQACSARDGFWDRSACGIAAEVSYAECLEAALTRN
jgi:hypothetical protein